MPECKDCGSKEVQIDREDWIALIAFTIAMFCFGIILSFNFITAWGFEELENGWHRWLSYMTFGPMLAALISVVCSFIVVIYFVVLWLERD